ncbi:PTS cellobiose transporter subunit IIA [Peribacillus muralis]|uniref:PTS cellobiose transporter subunit IIA n=1 Tax=Peribacillus muralis TaxID=264697 RepID=A0A1B3XMI7_9BACI|nr:PTS lactose/cellobiose transporter subunit IIA [Peribacillus muralis]AOH54425.1 PTS cellobiose transporter subunit IIA [Peribacillus muralis]
MEKEELYQLSFQLILYSGNARSFAMEAMQEAKKRNFESARSKIAESESELLQAHKYQTQLIHAEAGGDHFELPILLVHAQDHLMTAMTLKDLAIEMIDLREEFSHAGTVKEGTAE